MSLPLSLWLCHVYHFCYAIILSTEIPIVHPPLEYVLEWYHCCIVPQDTEIVTAVPALPTVPGQGQSMCVSTECAIPLSCLPPQLVAMAD